MTDVPQCLGMFRSSDRRTRISANERKLLVLKEFVPQRFQFDGGQYITRVPEEGNHFAVDVHPTADIECLAKDISENAPKCIPVDLPFYHELFHRRKCINHY